jgi:hypothetical protein
MTYRMLLPSQLSGQIPGTFAYPAQGILRIAPRFRLNETIQRDQEPGIALNDALPARARPANASRHCVSLSDLANSQGNGFS